MKRIFYSVIIGTEVSQHRTECSEENLDATLNAIKELPLRGEPVVKDIPATAEEVRAERDRLLDATDWTQVLDAPISAESRAGMRVYRQALRNVPQQPGFPTAVEWPVMPTIVPAEPDPVDEAFDVLTGEEAT